MKNSRFNQSEEKVKSLNAIHLRGKSEEEYIDIFRERMSDYLRKIKAASRGSYELDDYDLQVITVAMEQYASSASK
jgi:hypothetical protein